MLDRADHHMRADAAAANQCAEHCQVAGQCPGAGERQLVRSRTDVLGDLLPGSVERQPGSPARAIQPRRVRPAIL